MPKSYIKFKAKSLLFAFALSTSLVSCVQSPIDGKVVNNRQAQVTYSGTHSVTNRAISIQALDHSTGAYTQLGSTVSTYAIPDGEGTNWYAWSKAISLPTNPRYWKTAGSAPNRKATITTRAFDPASSLAFASFDLYGTICWYSYAQEGKSGLDMMGDCSTSNTVKLGVFCGDMNEPCCPQGLQCNIPITHVDPLYCKNSLCVKEGVVVTQRPGRPPIVEMPPDNIPCSSVQGAPCMLDLDASCNSGIDEVEGKWICRNGEPVCDAKKDVDYCRGCDDDGISVCGKCPEKTCMNSLECSPGNECKRVPGTLPGSWTHKCKPIVCDRKDARYCYLPWALGELPPAGSRTRDICE